MPYYKENNILFIHIPKTGGSVIEEQLKKGNHVSLMNYNGERPLDLLDYPYNTISLQHQFYRTLYQYKNRLNINFDNIKIFSVVRNPYDRIISDLFWWRMIRPEYTADDVYSIIKNRYLNRNNLDNHNKPQYSFVVDENNELIKNIKIFKTETLNKTNKELNKFLGVNLNIQQDNVNKDYSKYLNKDSISLINNIYKKDFEMFDYNFK